MEMYIVSNFWQLTHWSLVYLHVSKLVQDAKYATSYNLNKYYLNWTLRNKIEIKHQKIFLKKRTWICHLQNVSYTV